MTTASTRTIEKVVSYLSVAESPLRVSELVALTGLSTNTVRAALDAVGESDGRYPAAYVLREDIPESLRKRHRSLDMSGFTEGVIVPYDSYDRWIEHWPKIREVLDGLAERPVPEDDPAVLYRVAALAARLFSSLAYDIEQVKNQPDWYIQLGGLEQ